MGDSYIATDLDGLLKMLSITMYYDPNTFSCNFLQAWHGNLHRYRNIREIEHCWAATQRLTVAGL